MLTSILMEHNQLSPKYIAINKLQIYGYNLLMYTYII